MVRRWVWVLVLASLAASARADLLELSGFGGYTSLAMGQLNGALAANRDRAGVDQTTTKSVSQGYLAGLDLRTGALIPLPFFEVGLKAEYIGADQPGEAAGTLLGKRFDAKDDPSMVAGMAGLDFHIGIPATPLKVGVSAYGGYGEGLMSQSYSLAGSPTLDNYSNGGGFVGELEGRLDWKLVSVLSLYAFGGYRFAQPFGLSAGPVRFAAVPGGGAVKVDFSGATAGAGLNIDL